MSTSIAQRVYKASLCCAAVLTVLNASAQQRDSGAANISPFSNSPSRSAPAASDSPGPFGQDASAYSLTFSDEFENGFNSGVWNEAADENYSNAVTNFAVEDGSLKIWPARGRNGEFFNRIIDTNGKFYQRYGYFEMEAKLPIGKGTWPAFWLFNYINGQKPEIDIMEAYGGGSASGWSDDNYHPTGYAPVVWRDTDDRAGFALLFGLGDLSADYHKYAVKWEPGRQTFYFDGREVYSVNADINHPLYIKLDLLYGSAAGRPDASTPTGPGNSFDIRYVRAWQFR